MNCKNCGNEIPPKRLQILPNTKTCVKCSSTDKLVGVPVTIGEGDHTYNDLNIMTQETFKKYYRSDSNREKSIPSSNNYE